MDIPVSVILSYKLALMEPNKKSIYGYRLYLFTFIVLTLVTLLAVWFTKVTVIPGFAASTILSLAVIQALIVLFYNMHLKFNEKILTVFLVMTVVLLLILIIVTMLDYIYR